MRAKIPGIVRTIIVAATASAFAFTAQAETKWEMPTPYPEGEFHTKNVRLFVEDVARLTNGEVIINVHSAQSLYKHPEIKRAVQTNQVPIGEMLMANLLNDDPIFGADVVPFLATSHEEARRLWEVQRPVVQDRLKKKGLRLLYAVPWPGQGFYTKAAVDSVDDLRGVRFRTYNAATARMAELMGAEPAIVEAVEIPQAFSTGIVQAMVTSGATGVSSKAWDFVSYFYELNAWLPKNMIFVNEDAFRSLPRTQQQALLEAAKTAEERGWKMSEEAATSSVRELAASGMTVEKGSAQLLEQLHEIGAVMAAEWEKSTGETGSAMLAAYRN